MIPIQAMAGDAMLNFVPFLQRGNMLDFPGRKLIECTATIGDIECASNLPRVELISSLVEGLLVTDVKTPARRGRDRSIQHLRLST